jgi:hypothetical protein
LRRETARRARPRRDGGETLRHQQHGGLRPHAKGQIGADFVAVLAARAIAKLRVEEGREAPRFQRV